MNIPASRHRFGASRDALATVRGAMPVTIASVEGAGKRQLNTLRLVPPFAYRSR